MATDPKKPLPQGELARKGPTPTVSSKQAGEKLRELSVVHRPSKRRHCKSKDGCLNCKRRKVKCDETKPECSNCIKFSLPCSLSGTEHSSLLHSTRNGANANNSRPPSTARRRRGRPRRDWTDPDLLAKTSRPIDVSLESRVFREPDVGLNSNPGFELNMSQLELLFHFVGFTGPTLAWSMEDPVAKFWAQNVPQIGLHYPFVLHLALSLGSYHLMRLRNRDEPSRLRYLSLARQHGVRGIAELNEALPNLDSANCGAIYVSTVLECYRTIAAGPTGPNDLLVCVVGSLAPERWLPLARGTRLIHEIVDPADLYAGSMAPLAPSRDAADDTASSPTIEYHGDVRIDWKSHLDAFRDLLTWHANEGNSARLRSFDTVTCIYEATFGDEHGQYNGPSRYKTILVWIYLVDEDFAALLRNKDPMALLILSYYAPLLIVLQKDWFLKGWTEHLLSTIAPLLEENYACWLKWPVELVKQLEDLFRDGKISFV